MSRSTAPAVVSAALLATAVAAPSAAARPAVVTGKAPASARVAGHSLGSAFAVGAATGRVLAAERVSRRGAYRLKVAPGPVVILTPVVSRSGKVTLPSSRITRLRSGARKRVRVTRRRPRLRRRRAGAAQAGRTRVKYSVYGSRVVGGEEPFTGKVVDDMLITDAWAAGERAPCPATQFVDRQSDDFKVIQAEVALQQSPAFDPKSRVTPKWHLPENTPDTRISMTVSIAADGSATGTISARGPKGTVSRQVSGTVKSLFFTEPSGLKSALDEIFEELCRPGGLKAISGTFGGDSAYSGSRWTWSGNATFTRTPPSELPGANGTYLLTNGSVTYTASGRFNYAACQMSGTQQFSLGGGSVTVFGSPPSGLEPYSYGADIGTLYPGMMEVLVSGCEPGAESYEGTTQTIPVGGDPLDMRNQHPSDDGLVYEGNESRSEGGVTLNYNWSFKGEE